MFMLFSTVLPNSDTNQDVISAKKVDAFFGIVNNWIYYWQDFRENKLLNKHSEERIEEIVADSAKIAEADKSAQR